MKTSKKLKFLLASIASTLGLLIGTIYTGVQMQKYESTTHRYQYNGGDTISNFTTSGKVTGPLRLYGDITSSNDLWFNLTVKGYEHDWSVELTKGSANDWKFDVEYDQSWFEMGGLYNLSLFSNTQIEFSDQSYFRIVDPKLENLYSSLFVFMIASTLLMIFLTCLLSIACD